MRPGYSPLEVIPKETGLWPKWFNCHVRQLVLVANLSRVRNQSYASETT